MVELHICRKWNRCSGDWRAKKLPRKRQLHFPLRDDSRAQLIPRPHPLYHTRTARRALQPDPSSAAAMDANPNADAAMQDSSPNCPVRPWPVANADRAPKNISEYISLVNQTYPGGFRALNVDKIREGLEAGDESADAKMADGDDEDEGDDASDAKDPLEARNEALFSIVYVPTCRDAAQFPTNHVSL